MSLPKVAVIMATYEPSAAHLIGQLDSVQKQRNVEVDVYIGDDSKTSIVLEQIEGRYSNLIKSYESGPKSGRPVDNFLGIMDRITEDYEYYAFCDQDDIWLPQKLDRAITMMRKHSINGYSSEMIIYKKDICDGILTKRYENKRRLFGYFFSESAGCTIVISRRGKEIVKDALDEIKKKKISRMIISHDLLISVLINQANLGWFHDRISHILYRQHTNNEWGAKLTPNNIGRRIKMLIEGSYLNTITLRIDKQTNKKSDAGIIELAINIPRICMKIVKPHTLRGCILPIYLYTLLWSKSGRETLRRVLAA